MCPPIVVLAIASVAQIAVRTLAARSAAKAAQAQVNAIDEQNRVRRKAEIRNFAVDAARRRREAEIGSSRSRVLLAALGIAGGEGTAADVVGAPQAQFAIDNLFQKEALQNRIFSLDSTAQNQISDIGFQQQAANWELLGSNISIAGKAGSGIYQSYNTPTTED